MEQQQQKAFIASNKYLNKEFLSFGVGVVASFTEEAAKNDSFRIQNLDTNNEWYEIELPSVSSFLQLENLLQDNSNEVLSSLFSEQSISMLFYDDFILCKDDESKKLLIQQKIEELKNSLLTVDSLIEFITNKTAKKDLAITSSFLFMIGINGIIFEEKDSNQKRILVFDAKRSITLNTLNSGVLDNSNFSV